MSNDTSNTNATPATTDPADTTPRLALRPKDAARALGIGARLLWSLTNCGQIPHLRLGKAIVYPLDALRAWLDEQAGKGRRR